MVRVIVSYKKTKKIPLQKIQNELFEKSIKEFVEEEFGADAEAKIEGGELIISSGKEELVEINEEELLNKSIKKILREKGVSLKGAEIKIKK